MNAAQVLRDALAYMRGGDHWHKWLPGGLTDGPGVCALGALGLVCEPDTLRASEIGKEHLVPVIRSEYPERLVLSLTQTFNDHPDTTWADVERVFQKAIANADES